MNLKYNLMKNLMIKTWKPLLSLLFGVAVVIFWAVPFVGGLCFQEQYQMFLFDTGYFLERIVLPGGLADYISEFLVQFYYMPVLGGAIIALLLMGIQAAVWGLMKQYGARHDFPGYLLSFLPSIALWCAMGDQNVLLSFVVALFGALVIGWIHNRFHNRLVKVVFELVSTALVYWFLGPVVFLYAALMIGDTLKNAKQKDSILSGIGYSVCILVLTIAWILLTTQTLQYPLYRILAGLNYYRYPGAISPLPFVVMVWAVVIPFLGMIPCHRKSLQKLQQSKVVIVLSYVLVIVASWFGIKASFDEMTYDLIDYDFLVRTEQWDKIIEKAEKKPATTPLSVSCVNLALSQKGVLADRLFEFYQNGGEGLFPTFTRDMTSPVSTAEIFFRLGMVNDAERYMFEAQEAIPNYRKSARLTRRIIECEIINGNYQVAAKLLRRLQKTLFYSNWANQTMALLGNEKAINQHPIYGKLRKYREKKQDFLFSDREMDQMLGLLFLNDNHNRMAYEYLMCYELLQRDMEKFMQYYPLGRFVGYDHIPRTFQEILIGNWMKTHSNPRTIPYSVDAQNVNNTLNFIQLYMQNPKDPQLGQQPYVSNAWHYVMVQGADEAAGKKEGMKEVY
ncbi:MAG: DUF6057 family protein [Segatella copri]|jgi:hypothetical protein|uniref:DUF6057 family protein n=2 Tax=Segatella copri TaxID=165179 RepID=A0AAW5I669_9BACT|nr:DUF6057 family protein [Segatella copri]MCF0068596.1 DUF6057 family protein [Segatella copri]MCP9502520.1 DUF6057 family protein [Segatella copri]MCP9505629.1 DUF6057 family protein [Segatella copri]MCP9508629.1 DUF6057 family protein [Segatella copri]MCP9511555.1 DUF6057 family protein [Segatella copri]